MSLRSISRSPIPRFHEGASVSGRQNSYEFCYDPFPSFFGIQPMYESYWWREINAGEERGRTRLYRSVPAGVKVAGNGCPGTLGMTSRIGWRVQAPGARVHLSNAPAGAGGVLLVGLSDSQWGPFRLPLITDPYGLPGCTLHTSVEATVVATTGT